MLLVHVHWVAEIVTSAATRMHNNEYTYYTRWQWRHLLLLSCQRHVVGQWIVSDMSVVCSCYCTSSLCSEPNTTNLLLRLLTDVLGTSVLLHTPNTTYPTTWHWRVHGDHR